MHTCKVILFAVLQMAAMIFANTWGLGKRPTLAAPQMCKALQQLAIPVADERRPFAPFPDPVNPDKIVPILPRALLASSATCMSLREKVDLCNSDLRLYRAELVGGFNPPKKC